MTVRDPIMRESFPRPLYDVVRSVLHANLFATWQDDLQRWELEHPNAAPKLRMQMAQAALAFEVNPVAFRALSGHWMDNPEEIKSWFVEIFRTHYGRAPSKSDLGH